MKVVISEKNTDKRFYETNVKQLNNNTKHNVSINSEKTYQKIIGFGGSFTESACYNLYRINEDARKQALEAYFSEDGLNYSIGRLSIHGCDFSLNSYTYIEEGDDSLETFDISRDKQWVIPTIKTANEMANKEIKLVASPWSPPAFMKTNGLMIKGGELKPEYNQTWANYYIKFLEHYKNAGVNVWAMTVQNEPAAVQRWDSCEYTGEQERDFVKNYLGPTLKKSKFDNTKLIVWDHNRDLILERASAVLSDKEAAKYVWGTGYHWYETPEASAELTKVHNAFPDKHLIFTEGCQEAGPHIGVWKVGERYARNIINDLNNYSEAFIDWNLFLDTTGGPNHVNNLCSAPILIDVFPEKIIKNPAYYYIGHFSKYIKPDAVRVDVENTNKNVLITACKNPNGEIVVVAMNDKESKEQLNIKIGDDNVAITLDGNSIATVIK